MIRSMTLQILILAAGRASRMRGTDKLLETINAIPQIRRIAEAALATGLPCHIALPPDRPLRAAALQDLPIHHIPVPDAASGMGVSLRTAAASIPPGALMILLADLVEITTADLRTMIAAHHTQPQAILRGASNETPGHPTVIPADLRPALCAVSGDTGARALITAQADRTANVPLPAGHATTDLDTPEDWAAWRALRGA
jgi:molybdenum cofactor cytidylyltransferase